MAKRRSKSELRIEKLRGKYKHLDLMKGLADAREEERNPKKSRRLGALKGLMKIKGDIIHSNMEDDWEVQ